MSDLGITLVHEFHQIFNCAIGNSADPSVPSYNKDVSFKPLVNYASEAAELGERLKIYAASAKKQGDEAGAMLLIRLQLIQEELSELAEALIDRDIVNSFDALLDLSYVTDGTYIALGLYERKAVGLLEVHRSNMSKLDKNRKPIISDAGRVMKSDRYSPPDLKSIVDR